MTATRRALGILLIAALAPGRVLAADDGRLTEVEGEARIAGTDAPASHLTIRFGERDEPGRDAATDAEGRFRWPVPSGVSVHAGEDGQVTLVCWALAQDERHWTLEIVGASPHLTKDWPQSYARKRSLEQLLRPTKTYWRVRDGRPRLIVECPPTGDVAVAVRGPDGMPLVDHEVRVFPAESPLEFQPEALPRLTGRTDGEGRFRMRWFEGMRRLRVLAPGVGFGSTGTFEVVAGREAQAELPPLARFARVEGSLDPALARPGTTVGLGSPPWRSRAWDLARADCDDRGRFALADVVPGLRTIQVIQGGNPVRVQPARIQVEPGRRIDGLALRPAPPDPRPGPVPRIGRPPGRAADPAPEITWVEGTARDEAGHPVAGAEVLVHTSYHGGIRMYEEVRVATTDAVGHFRVTGPAREAMEPPTVIVHAQGHPPAVAYGQAPKPGLERPPLDVTLAAKGGEVRVAVTRDGKPLPGAGVRLASEGVVALSDWAYVGRARGPGRDRIEALFFPAARCGADGVARFQDLFPGTYEVLAADAPQAPIPGFRQFARHAGLTYGVAEGIAVAAGRAVEHAVAVHPQPCTVRFQVLRPDGMPVARQDVAFGFGLGAPGATTSLTLDERGIGTYAFGAPGLWSVDVRFRDAPLTSFPISREPYYQAEALLPVSPGLALDEPVRLVGVRRDRGALRVRLLDVAGNPARGTVMIVGNDLDGAVEYAGTTDAEGDVRFADLSGGRYELRGSIDGLDPAFDPGLTGPFPDDDAALLRGGVAVLGGPATVEAGVEARAELRAQRVGYVRGMLRPPAGRRASDYQVFPAGEKPGRATTWRFDPETGRFACGPLPAGAQRVIFRLVEPEGTSREAGSQEVEVPPGGVARVELRPREDPLGPTRSQSAMVLLGMGGISTLEAVPRGAGGTAWMTGGETPAPMAQGLVFVPDHEQPIAVGVADAAGNLTWRGRWISGAPAPREGGRVARPTAVIWLPGLCGGAVVEVDPGRPIRAVLPPPLAARGHVTLGGRPIDGRNARVRVVAAYRGRGPLDAALGRGVTADADGRFELRGLTPGEYRVQAACDGIWLSQGVALRVEEGREVPDVALDIPEPGGPVVVTVVDRAGRPVAHRALSPVRPEGPLSSLWPESVRTDAAGTVTLRGLEAGAHALRIDGEPVPRSFRVPAVGDAAATPRIIRFVYGPAP